MNYHEKFNQAEQARNYWLKNSLYQYDYILMLPHHNTRLNYILCEAFERKVKTEKRPCQDICKEVRALVLSVDNIKESNFYTFKLITEEVAENILTLYGMYRFTDNLIIGDFELSYGRKIKNLLDCGITSETNIIESVLF